MKTSPTGFIKVTDENGTIEYIRAKEISGVAIASIPPDIACGLDYTEIVLTRKNTWYVVRESVNEVMALIAEQEISRDAMTMNEYRVRYCGDPQIKVRTA